jgi:hypothetical protein
MKVLMNAVTRNRRVVASALALIGVLPTAALAAGVQVGTAAGPAGSTVTVEVTLTGEASELVAGTQNDIRFDKDQLSVPAVAENGNKPDCSVNPAIDKKIDGSETFGFGFLNGTEACDPASGQCDTIRAIVLSTDNVDAIPPGSVLYSCRFAVKPGVAAGTQITLTVPEGSAIGSDPTGQRVAAFAAAGGSIQVEGGGGCVGDCSGTDGVSIGELQIGLNIFFGSQGVATCPAFDPENTGAVGIGQLQVALNNFFNGCGS